MSLLTSQLATFAASEPISLPIPSDRYFDLFVALVQRVRKPLLVADAKELFIFYPPGGVLCVTQSLATFRVYAQ